MTDLAELHRRVNAATGPDIELERDLSIALSAPWYDDTVPMLVSYALGNGLEAVGAALALVERLLPGWRWYLADSDRSGGKPVASVFAPDEIVRTGRIPRSECATPALAVLLALLDALHADGRAA